MRVSHSTCIGSLQVVTSLFHASLLASLLFGSNQLLPGTDAAEVPRNEHHQQQERSQTSNQGTRQHESKPVIHKQMNENDLRKVFQVQSHDEVPEYDIVHLRVINKRSITNQESSNTNTLHFHDEEAAAENDDYLTSKRSKRNSNKDDGNSDGGTLKYVYLNAFGDGMHLNLKRNDDLHHKLKSIKLITAESSTSSRWTPSHDEGVRYSESMIQGEGEDSVGVPYHDDQHVAAVIVSTGPDGQVTLVSSFLPFLPFFHVLSPKISCHSCFFSSPLNW